MEDWLRRYVDARRDACAARPALHEHELAALAAGAVAKLAEAERLDRVAGQARSDAAAGERGPAGRNATAAFTRLVLDLIAVHGASAGLPEAVDLAQADRAALDAADPAFSLTRAPYALRLPWGDAVVGVWLEAKPAAAPPEDAPGLPDAAGWRAGLTESADAPVGDPAAAFRALAAAPAEDTVARATRAAAAALVAAADAAPSPQEALIVFVTAGLLARFAAAGLRARAEQALARQAFWPDELTRRHWRTLIDDLDGARTPTEVALVAHHAAACFAVESDWNLLMHGALTTPLIAAIAHDLEPGERKAEGVRRAALTTHALTGLGPRAALADPRTAGLVGRDIGGHGTEEGEAGYDLVGAARVWSEQSGEPATAAAVERALDRVQAPEPPADPRPLRFWGAVGGSRPPLPGSLP